MLHISTFSGVGGFDLAAEWMGWKNIASCEINDFGNKILEYYWPDAYHHRDIHTFTYEKLNDELTKRFGNWRTDDIILTGGFPCQPYSAAGKRKGKEDDRHLWPQMCRAIREIQPRWVVGENVSGLLNWNRGMVLDEIKADLEAAGFEVLPPLVLPACGVGAPHRRDRVWICARNKNCGRENSIDRFGGFPKGESGGLENLWEQLRSNKNKPENGVVTQVLNERTEGDGCGSYQSESIGQPEREFEISPALYQYSQQEEEGWGPFTEGEEQMEGDNLCEQPENLVGAIRQRGTSNGSIPESEGEIRIDDTEENGDAANTDSDGQQRGNSEHEINTGEGGQYAQRDIEQMGKPDATYTEGLRINREKELENNKGQSGKRGGCNIDNISEVPNKNRDGDATNTDSSGWGESAVQGELRAKELEQLRGNTWETRQTEDGEGQEGGRWQQGGIPNWDNFPTQPPICGINDGISYGLDGITFSKWRNESIKAYGNAVVPQIVYEIFKAITLMEHNGKNSKQI